MILLDVDHFKKYNDAHGHLAGDDCLREVARTLQASARRPEDLVARYGGEEFVVILPETERPGGLAIAEMIRERLRVKGLLHGAPGAGPLVTLSMGGASMVPGRDIPAAVLIEHADRIDWSRALIDSASVRAPRGGQETGPNPTDRRKSGSKHHVLTDGQGIPLAMTLTGANRHDVAQLLPLVDAVPPVRGKRGRPRRRPEKLQGDRAYDSGPHRRELRRRGIRPVLAKRRTAHGSGLGVYRWFVERTLSWTHQFGRLRLRRDRLPQIHKAFMALGCSLICLRFIT